MGHGKGKSAGGRQYVPPPVADYNVTGDPHPNCKCNYWETGIHNGQPYYLREGGGYVIWWNGVTTWFISTTLGIPAQPLWVRINPAIVGQYNPFPPTVGVVTVSEGPH